MMGFPESDARGMNRRISVRTQFATTVGIMQWRLSARMAWPWSCRFFGGDTQVRCDTPFAADAVPFLPGSQAQPAPRFGYKHVPGVFAANP